MEPLVGQSLGRYEVTGFLGSGGMGAVYRAHDSRLDRDVAIKVLPDVRKDSRHLEHFRREATIVAKLSHPNILEIHDFGFDHEHPYAVMELLEGKDLRETMRGRPMATDKATDIAVAVADGLAAAHTRGVVHRDIKPENIFITSRGLVKILDFGIARPGPDPEEPIDVRTDEATLTKTGAIVGTAGYMAPEQIRGQKVDDRSDIFALGCVLYELLSGRHPFRRANSIDTLLAIVEESPNPLAETAPGLPPALAMIVHRCLEKDPEDRFDSARDVAFSLRAISQHGAFLPPIRPRVSRHVKRIAPRVAAAAVMLGLAVVLGTKLTDILPSSAPLLPESLRLAVAPFNAVGDDTDLAQFAAGTSEILAEDLDWLLQSAPGDGWLAQPQLARNLDCADAQSFHRMFDANVVLTGTVDRRGPRMRIQLTAIEPRSGATYRSVEIDGDLGNVSSLQLDPVERAAELIGLVISPESRDVLTGRTTNVSRAFHSYLRARGILVGKPDEAATDLAIDLLEQATDLDPLFVPAREAHSHALALKFKATADLRFYDQGVEEARHAAEERPSAGPQRRLAALYTVAGDHEAAAAALERAVELEPKNGEAHMELGFAYQKLGRTHDADLAFQRSTNLRPGYWKGPDVLGRLYIGDGRYDAAANCFRRVIECAPLSKVGYNVLGVILFLQDDLESSRRTFERSIEVDPEDNYFAFANLGTLHFNAARFADAITVYEQALAISDTDYNVWGNLAFAYAFGAEPEKADEPFARAIELAEERRADDPENLELLGDLAGYYAMVEQPETSRSLLDSVIELEPSDPQLLAKIGETYEDLGEREAALEWIGRALAGGIPPGIFDSRPMLRDLVADPRYRSLVEKTPHSTE